MPAELRDAKAIAKAFGKSVESARRWIRSGCPKPPAPKKAVEAWLAAREKASRAKKSSQAISDRDDAGVGAAAKAESEEWAIRLRRARAQKAELEYRLSTGELIEREKAAELFADRVIELRSNLLLMPRRVAPQFPPEIRDRLLRILEEEVRAMCEQYSRPADLLEVKTTATKEKRAGKRRKKR